MVQIVENKKRKTREPADECPICLDTIKMGLMTSCGHRFCGDCSLEVWRTRKSASAMSCPLCRQEVRGLEPCLSEEERSTREAAAVERRTRISAEAGRYKQEVRRYKQEAGRYKQEVDKARAADRAAALLVTLLLLLRIGLGLMLGLGLRLGLGLGFPAQTRAAVQYMVDC